MLTRRPADLIREHPEAADWWLAAVLALVGVIAAVVGGEHGRGPGWFVVGILLVPFETVPLAWRRTRPGMALRLVGAATVVAGLSGHHANLDGSAVVIALYSFAEYRSRRSDIWTAVAVAAAVAGTILVADLTRGPGQDNANYAWAAAVFVSAWVVGDHLRTRRADAAVMLERAARLERERTAEAERAVAEERIRIARELHDVVAHSLGVIAMQAGGADRSADLDTDEARGILRSVAHISRQALGEMRRLVGVLRDEQDDVDLSPQPGVEDIATLIDEVRSAGLTASLSCHGEPRPVPSGVGLSAYRIVQEALTNILRHAGPAKVCVTLRWLGDSFEVEVVDDGRGAAAALDLRSSEDPSQGGDGPGHGLIGMRERVSVFGGELAAGPRAGGGFVVRARIPFAGTTP